MSNRFKWDLGCCIWNMLSKRNLLQPDIVVLACISKSNPHSTNGMVELRKNGKEELPSKCLNKLLNKRSKIESKLVANKYPVANRNCSNTLIYFYSFYW